MFVPADSPLTDSKPLGLAAAIDAYDWHESPVGDRALWPQNLLTALDICLESPFPMVIFWGPELIQLYNDSFATLIRMRHPQALGQPARDCWPEVWDVIGPMIVDVVETGNARWFENLPLALEDDGIVADRYFTFSYSRIASEPDSGVFCTASETTASVLREREATAALTAFREMSDQVAHVMYSHGADGSIEWANRRWYDYTQLPREIATLPAGWARVTHPDDLPRAIATLEAAIASGESYEMEIRFKPLHADERGYRSFLVRSDPMRDLAGAVYRWVGTATDIHGMRLAEEAARVALEGRLAREHIALLAFQGAALPQHLPSVPGLHFSAVYEAAEAESLIGGDWYDAFRLNDGRVVLSIGDVMGSGLHASITMAAVRQAIRGAAQIYPDPCSVLDAADRTLRSEQPDGVVTAFVGVLDPLTSTMIFASAGHPPPLLRYADGTILELLAQDLPLGLRADNRRAAAAQSTIVIPENSLLVLYTDGLTESTHDIREGEKRLNDALLTTAIFESSEPATALRDAVLDLANDDVAILAIRVGDAQTQIARLAGLDLPARWAFHAADAAASTAARRSVAAVLRGLGMSAGDTADAELVLGELIGNVVRHTGGEVEVALDLSGDTPVIHVLDRGPGFTFHARLPQDTMSESGRGLFIAAALTRDISVVPRNDGGSHARLVLSMDHTVSRRGIGHSTNRAPSRVDESERARRAADANP